MLGLRLPAGNVQGLGQLPTVSGNHLCFEFCFQYNLPGLEGPPPFDRTNRGSRRSL